MKARFVDGVYLLAFCVVVAMVWTHFPAQAQDTGSTTAQGSPSCVS